MERKDVILGIVAIVIMLLVFRNQITGFFIGPGEGGFIDTGDEICTEDGKPIVYFFGSSSCPHCAWEKPVVQGVVAEFGDSIVYKENIDSEEDEDVLVRYSSGGVPFIVIGCKYVRNGAGEFLGEMKEAQVLKGLICRVAESPVCG